MATHRYWRIALNTGGSGAYAFSEVQFRAVAATPLLFASATPATAAQTFGTVPGANDATQAADNNTATLYSSNNKTPPQWWAYDYGATAGNWLDVVEFTITSRNDFLFGQAPLTFDLQYSDDNVGWTTVGSFIATTWTQNQTQVFTVPPPAGPQSQLPWQSLAMIRKPVVDRALLDDDDAFTALQQQRLTRHPRMWGGLILAGVYVDAVAASKFVQHVVLDLPDGLLASKAVQYVVTFAASAAPKPSTLIGHQLRSMPGMDIGNEATPNLTLQRRRFVSPDAYVTPPASSPVALVVIMG